MCSFNQYLLPCTVVRVGSGKQGASSPLSEIRSAHKETQLQFCCKGHQRVDWLATASETKYQKSGDLKQLTFMSLQFWKLEVQSQGGHTLSEGSKGGAFLFSSTFLFVASPPRHSLACLCVTATSVFITTWCSPCVLLCAGSLPGTRTPVLLD